MKSLGHVRTSCHSCLSNTTAGCLFTAIRVWFNALFLISRKPKELYLNKMRYYLTTHSNDYYYFYFFLSLRIQFKELFV